MVGRVHFRRHGRDAVATMGDDYRWAVSGLPPDSAATVRLVLDGPCRFHPSEYSPAHGSPGAMQVEGAARRLGGLAEFPTRPGPPAGPLARLSAYLGADLGPDDVTY